MGVSAPGVSGVVWRLAGVSGASCSCSKKRTIFLHLTQADAAELLRNGVSMCMGVPRWMVYFMKNTERSENNMDENWGVALFSDQWTQNCKPRCSSGDN